MRFTRLKKVFLINDRSVLYAANAFFLILNYKYCHNVTSDRFSPTPTNSHNDVIHGNFNTDLATKSAETRSNGLMKQ